MYFLTSTQSRHFIVRKKMFASVTHLYPQRCSNGSASVRVNELPQTHTVRTDLGGNRPTPLQDVTQRKEEKYDALLMRQISP